jgi:hypothetical protein
MTTEAVNPGNPYGASATELFEGEQLTGEALMLFISSRLNSLDEDVQALLGQMDQSLARKAYVNEVKEWTDKVAAAKEAGNNDELTALYAAFPCAPAGSEALQQQALAAYNSVVPEITPENLERFRANLDGILDELNGQSEMTMIRLQQLMGQRQVAVQLTTNLLSKFNQGFEAIVGNLR